MAVANRFLGNADTATTATNSTKLNNQDASYYLNYNNFSPTDVSVPYSNITRRPIVMTLLPSGYRTRAAVGVQRGAASAWGEALFSVGNNDVGTSFVDFRFNVNGRIYSPAGTFALQGEAQPANGGTSAACSGNSATASKWQTPRTITVNGNSSGSVTLDGSANVTLNLTNSYASGAGTAVQLTNTRTIFGQNFNGTANVVGRGVFYGVGSDTARYNGGAIEVREANLVAAGQSDMRYAPRIGFHWGGRYGNNLIMASDGEFRFTTSNDASYANVRANIFYGALSGNATTATTATNSNQLGGVAAANYLQKSGGTVTGTIARAGYASSWVSGRNYVVAKTSSSSGYSPAFSAKSASGSWDIGTYTNDVLWFSYITDADYNAGNNVKTASFQFRTDSSIVAPGGFIGTSTKSNYATNSEQLGGIAASSYLNTSDTLILRGTV